MPVDFQPVQTLAEQIILFIPTLLGAILIFLGFWIASAILRTAVRRYGHRMRLDEQVRDLMTKVLGAAIIVMGLISALGTIGIDVTAMVAGLGLTSFALAFALQDIISNVLAGILILMYHPFRRGNQVKVGSHEGIVTDIDLRYTTLQTETQKIFVPNATLFREAIIVYTPGGQPVQKKL